MIDILFMVNKQSFSYKILISESVLANIAATKNKVILFMEPVIYRNDSSWFHLFCGPELDRMADCWLFAYLRMHTEFLMCQL